MTLEERITRLEDIEAIRYLQSKYQRCLDTRDFDGLAECFTDDAVSSYGDGSMSYQGKEAIVHFLADTLGLNITSTHFIHGSEVDILDTEHAHAKWYLEDFLLHDTYKAQLHGAAVYNVDYIKKDGTWLIQSIGYNRCFEYYELRGLVNLFSLHKRTFFDKLRKSARTDYGTFGQYFWDKVKGKK